MRYKLLKQWLSKCLVENSDNILADKKAVAIYSILNDMFLEDVQKAFRELVGEVQENK